LGEGSALVLVVLPADRIPFDRCLSRRDRVGTVDPAAEVDEPATGGAEGEGGMCVERLGLERTGADGTSSSDHDVVPLVEAFGDSDFAGAGVEVEEEASAALGVASAGLSAWADFL
jgi:hypothetical protein